MVLNEGLPGQGVEVGIATNRPLGLLGFNLAQHSPTTRSSVERTAEKAFCFRIARAIDSAARGAPYTCNSGPETRNLKSIKGSLGRASRPIDPASDPDTIIKWTRTSRMSIKNSLSPSAGCRGQDRQQATQRAVPTPIDTNRSRERGAALP